MQEVVQTYLRQILVHLNNITLGIKYIFKFIIFNWKPEMDPLMHIFETSITVP